MKLKNLIDVIYGDLTIEIFNEDLTMIFKGKVWDIPDKLNFKKIRWVKISDCENRTLMVSIKK